MSGFPILDLPLDTSTTPNAAVSANGGPPAQGVVSAGIFTAANGQLVFNGQVLAQCLHQFDGDHNLTTDAVRVAETLAMTLNAAVGKAVAGV